MGTWLGIEAMARNVAVLVSALSGAPECPVVPGISDSVPCEERQAIVERNKARYTPTEAELAKVKREHLLRGGKRDPALGDKAEPAPVAVYVETMPGAEVDFDKAVEEARKKMGIRVVDMTKIKPVVIDLTTNKVYSQPGTGSVRPPPKPAAPPKPAVPPKPVLPPVAALTPLVEIPELLVPEVPEMPEVEMPQPGVWYKMGEATPLPLLAKVPVPVNWGRWLAMGVLLGMALALLVWMVAAVWRLEARRHRFAWA